MMYLDYFALKERPFSISPDPRFLFMSNRYREALTHLTYGVQDSGGFVLLTGEVGTGKTTVCRCLLQQLPDNTRLAFVLNPKLNSVELLATICDELDIVYPEDCNSLKKLTDCLTDYLVKCYQKELTVVVMIDEAQNLETEVLEQVRLLTNLETHEKKLLQVILVGQPELQEKLAQRNLRQLAQRITARYHLRPLNLKETMAYIIHRTRIAGSQKGLFSRQAIELLHAKTQGIPRLINTVCDRALLAAATRNKQQVDQLIMGQAVKEIMGEAEQPKVPLMSKVAEIPNIKPILMASLFVMLMAFAYWIGRTSQAQPQTGLSVDEIKSETRQRPARQSAEETTRAANEQGLVDKIIGQASWDHNGLKAFQTLFHLWQIDYSAFANGDPCQFAKGYGLRCESGTTNWQQLRLLNRPAVIKFNAGLQGHFWVLLKELQGLNATLVVGEQELSFSLQELSTIWSGDYQMLWQAPKSYRGDFKKGDQGQAVTWLSESLNFVENAEKPISSIFDNQLEQRLMAFQRSQNIQADGIAGMQTILKVNAKTLYGIPLLTAVNQE